MIQLTLDDALSRYPQTPGSKEKGGTSEEAARAIADRVKYLRGEVCRILRQSPEPLTADTVAEIMGVDKLSIRPRFSELKEAGRVIKTELRGKNASGHSAVKWRAA